MSCYDKALAIEPSNKDILNGEGWCCYLLYSKHGSEEMFQKAFTCFDDALKIDPQFAVAWWHKAELIHKKNPYKNAVALQYCDRAMELDPSLSPAWMLKAQICEDFGWYEQAHSLRANAPPIKNGVD